MPPRSPLPQRHGLDAAWVRTPDRDPANPMPWATMGEWLWGKLGEHIDVDEFLAGERFVYGDGRQVFARDLYDANTFVWFHRDLRFEPEVPGTIDTVYEDERILVVDKPPFLSTIPRGKHVQQSVVVKLRDQLGLPELVPAHRLDRLTSGLLLLTKSRPWRGPYQSLFQDREVKKTYLALAAVPEQALLGSAPLGFPVTVRNHLHKQHGTRRVEVIDGATPNSESRIDVVREVQFSGPGARPDARHAIYRLEPHTGKTHQLRQHMASLGLAMTGDPLFPEILATSIDDFTTPLQLLAYSLEFIDPVDGTPRRFESRRAFPVVAP